MTSSLLASVKIPNFQPLATAKSYLQRAKKSPKNRGARLKKLWLSSRVGAELAHQNYVAKIVGPEGCMATSMELHGEKVASLTPVVPCFTLENHGFRRDTLNSTANGFDSFTLTNDSPMKSLFRLCICLIHLLVLLLDCKDLSHELNLPSRNSPAFSKS